ncbi:MAG: type II secretion system F family protein [Microbacteriaceae bacterium]
MIEVGLGAVLGLGVWILVDASPRASLLARIAPHVRDVSSITQRAGRVREIVDVLAVIAPHPVRFLVAEWRGRPSARRRAIDSELSAFLDLAGVCLSAGLSVPAMFERAGRGAVGVLGREAATIAREVSAGGTLAEACTASERRVAHESWSRLIEHLLTARRHGTPISDIVRSLAADERAATGRRLIEAASSREILMLVPLVFVILPMTVLVAVFPGLIALGSLPV